MTRHVGATMVAKLLLVLSFAAVAAPTSALERIVSYDSQVEIRTDGSLEVTERITVRAEGDRIRRGIYRDFPTRYRDRHGNRVVVGFEMLEVLRDGTPEPWFTEGMSNGIRINTGNDDFLPVPAEYSYTLRYRTTRQLGFFDAHDELYWNAIGTGWDFPIERGEVIARLPQPVPVGQMEVEAYTGPQGAQGGDYTADLPAPGTARWRLTRPLSPGEGFTVVLMFPKGIVVEPDLGQSVRWFLADNRGVLVTLAALVVLLGYCVRRWHRVGRDPRPGVVITRYEPPIGFTPGGLRYMRRMGYDPKCFSVDLIASAVAGLVRLRHDKPLLKRKKSWQVDRLYLSTSEIGSEEQRCLLTTLFPEHKGLIIFDEAHGSLVRLALRRHSEALAERLQPAYFSRNYGSVAVATAGSVAAIVAGLFLSGGSAVSTIFLIAAAMVVTLVLFAILVKAPTADGRRLLDEIEGFTRYLAVAESRELAHLQPPVNPVAEPPALDAQRYQRLLAFAVALDVEAAWTRKFVAAVGESAAAKAASSLSWYQGNTAGGLGKMANALGGSLSAQISSASTPPGSSSGGGGGGSSGGGGGGGGGGGR